ncbi:MAG: cation diffusion facilitator family transporter [Chloroflexota bacterium]
MGEQARHTELSGGALRSAFFLTTAILAVEAAAGVLAHSLALLADAGHILTDVVALGLAWFAIEQAKRPPDLRRTYGYHRVGILTAMVNGATLIAIVVAVAFEAARRLSHPEPVQGALVIGAALVAIAVNAVIGSRLKTGNAGNLNVRAALLHVIGDLAASTGVIVSGVVILATGWYLVDPIISLVIAAIIAWGAVRVVLDTGNILLEGVPGGVDLAAIRASIGGAQGVDSVHDLHVWALSPEHLALSCHVVVSEERLSEGEHLVRRLEQALCADFEIGHTTIQVEACHQCEAPDDHGAEAHNHPHDEVVREALHGR